MTGKGQFGNPVPVNDVAMDILDPVLRKRAGISLGLVQSWEEIVGERLAGSCRPEKIQWPRRMHEEDPFQPAALVIACDGMAALHLQHQSGEIIGRVNAFLGYAAIGRLKLVQKPLSGSGPKRMAEPPTLSATETAKLAQSTSGIEDDALRESLQKLGSSILAEKKRKLAPS
jgi:hypothetical protein